MNEVMRHVHTEAASADDIVADLRRELPEQPQALVLFFAPDRPGEDVARQLTELWPTTPVIACSTAGEISQGRIARGTVSAAAFGSGLVRRAAAAVADLSDGVGPGMQAAIAQLEAAMGPLNRLDPATHVGIVLIDSVHQVEEDVLIQLGNAAPLLSFVGGSAGDNLAFQQTRVVAGSTASTHGCALMVLEVTRPFRVVKSCHFAPTEAQHVVTKSDGRLLIELDGRPAAEVYAEYVGCTPAELSLDNLFMNPGGLSINGQSWVRQVNPPFTNNGAVILGCTIVQGSQFHFMKRNEDLVTNLRNQLTQVRSEVGEIRGALLFDCALRMLELQQTGEMPEYTGLIDFPAAGFCTHGESWIGHMHQTLTGLFFG